MHGYSPSVPLSSLNYFSFSLVSCYIKIIKINQKKKKKVLKNPTSSNI